MRLYTIQAAGAWQLAEGRGCLEGDAGRGWGTEACFIRSYGWMKQQMHKRVPSYQGEDLLWHWLAKPDMRATSHGPSGQRVVRLTLDVPDDRVLLSDFIAWHNVLNDTPIHETEEAMDTYYEAPKESRETAEAVAQKERSWQGIFPPHDTRWVADWGYNGEVCYQATTGKLPLSAVKKVEFFTLR